MSAVRHLRDYVLHDIEGSCYEVSGTACGILSQDDPEWIHWDVFPQADQITCGNCRRTRDFRWVEEHPCCTAP